MSEISTRIRKYLNNPEVNDPEVTKHYGRWCAFNRDQRRQIRELCNTCDMFEKTADSFWIEIERLKAEIERLEKNLDEKNEELDKVYDALADSVKISAVIRAEAVKEFAEMIKRYSYKSTDWSRGEHPMVVEVDDIENLVDEFTEGRK